MKPWFQGVFTAPGTSYPLGYIGASTRGEWSDGVLVGRFFKFPVYNGVPLFTDVTGLSREEILGGAKAYIGIVERNLHQTRAYYKRIPPWESLCREIASTEGLILEVGIGPGGGFMPCVLDINDQTRLLGNDIDHRVVYAWKNVLNREKLGVNTSFAVFDATRMPIKPGSFDAVASFGGISNIPYSYIVLKEAHRVLKLGGKLVLVEGIISGDDFKKLPNDIQVHWMALNPFLAIGYREFLEELGFRIKYYRVYGEKELSPSDSTLAKIAEKFSVKLRVEWAYIVAVKEQRRVRVLA